MSAVAIHLHSGVQRLRRTLVWTAVLLAASDCAARSSGGNAPFQTDRNLLTAEELREHKFSTVFEAIEALRSNWLRERGPDSFSTPTHVQVYLDDTRLGGVETLRTLSTANVVFIRHVNGIDAAARWGLDHGQGVILVSTRR